jgi:hypothetical protein
VEATCTDVPTKRNHPKAPEVDEAPAEDLDAACAIITPTAKPPSVTKTTPHAQTVAGIDVPASTKGASALAVRVTNDCDRRPMRLRSAATASTRGARRRSYDQGDEHHDAGDGSQDEQDRPQP